MESESLPITKTIVIGVILEMALELGSMEIRFGHIRIYSCSIISNVNIVKHLGLADR